MNNENIEIMNDILKKKSNKGKNIIIILLILIILGLTGYILYDKGIIFSNNNQEADCTKCNVSDNKDENKTKDDNNNNNNEFSKKSDVPIEDTYALSVNSSQSGYIDFYLLNNGVLYYKTVKEEEACKKENGFEDCWYQTSILNPEYENADRKLTKFNGITNIRRIKGTNTVSTGQDFNVLLITEDGKVYEYFVGSSEARLENMVKDYDVDDIIEYVRLPGCLMAPEETSCGGSFKIITKDGRTVTGEMDHQGKIIEK